MSDLLTFQPGVSLADGRYLLRSSVQPGRWSVTIQGIRAQDLTAVIIKTPIAPQGKSRFQAAWTRRTFQALGDLNHPSRNRILDWFEQDGRPFLVLQKVKGASLEQQLQKGPLSEAVALQLIRQIAAGLSGIHSQGLLHRDIKPKNIILRQGVGIPTLVDWGLQLAQCPADRLTPFSAPEQLKGGDIFKNRLDIYSLAATLYAAVTGQSPLHPAERQYQVPNPGPSSFAGLIPPRQLQPNLSSATEQAILQGMTLEPSQRPATLENWLQLFPLSHSSDSAAQQGRARTQSVPSSAGPRGFNPNSPVTGNANPGQIWATQPPPSQVSVEPGSAGQAPVTSPPAFSSSRSGSAQQHDLSQPETQAATAAPSLPQRPSSPNPPGTNYVLSEAGASQQSHRRGSPPQNSAPPYPSEQQQVQPSKLGTVFPSRSSRNTRPPVKGSFSQATHPSKAMVGAAQRSDTSSVDASFKPLKRLTSISLLMASIGLAGGLLLRIINPGSVAGFSGLGRVQDFPEADWPGETQLDDIPGDVPQPEYDDRRWDALEEELPDVILDEEVVQDEVLAAPSDRWDEAEQYSENGTVEDYGEAIEQAVEDDYGEEAYSQEDYSPEDYGEEDYGGTDYGDESYSEDYGEEYVEPYEGDEAAAVSGENDYYSDVEPESSASDEGWEEDPWAEEAPADWQEAPSITADDFPEPDFPPAYEEPLPQGINPMPAEGDALYEDV